MFKKYHFFELPRQNRGVVTPWLAFPLVIRGNSPFQRKELQIFLEKNNIQTRTIFTGNILRQPIMKNRKFKKIKNAEEEANNVMKNGLLIGCHQGLTESDLRYMTKIFDKFLKNYL